MGGAVGIVEGDAVPGDVVVAIGKAAEIGLVLAESDAIRTNIEGSRTICRTVP
jgi:hypothetical protein